MEITKERESIIDDTLSWMRGKFDNVTVHEVDMFISHNGFTMRDLRTICLSLKKKSSKEIYAFACDVLAMTKAIYLDIAYFEKDRISACDKYLQELLDDTGDVDTLGYNQLYWIVENSLKNGARIWRDLSCIYMQYEQNVEDFANEVNI